VVATIQSWFTSDLHLIQKIEKHLLANENIQNKVKKWLRAQDAFFSLKIETDLVIMGQNKASMRLSPISYSVCCYFI
jgi:hypothetical protein